MAKYRITIENLEGGDYAGTDTVELENLVIFGKPANMDEDSTVIIHGMTMVDIAAHLATDEHLLQAALIANGLYCAQQANVAMKRDKAMDAILRRVLGHDQ